MKNEEEMTAGERRKIKQLAKQDAEEKAAKEKARMEKDKRKPEEILKRLVRMEELQGGDKNSRKKQLLEKIAEKYKDV